MHASPTLSRLCMRVLSWCVYDHGVCIIMATPSASTRHVTTCAADYTPPSLPPPSCHARLTLHHLHRPPALSPYRPSCIDCIPPIWNRTLGAPLPLARFACNHYNKQLGDAQGSSTVCSTARSIKRCIKTQPLTSYLGQINSTWAQDGPQMPDTPRLKPLFSSAT